MINYKISTRTVIASTNVEFNIHDIYEKLPALEMSQEYNDKYMSLIPLKKRRGRRKKNEECLKNLRMEYDEMVDLKEGDIVAIYFRNHKKGLPQYLKYGVKFFRNALNIVMMRTKDKKINMKLSQNGKIQMTGCKEEEDAQFCLKYLFQHISEHCPDSLVYKENMKNNHLDISFFTVMTNLDFNIGFHINRQKLNQLINRETVFNSLLETSFGYTGVNIKIEVPYDPDVNIDRLQLLRENNWSKSFIKYDEYLQKNGEMYYKNELQKKRYNTFLVFHSGNIIMSGMRLDKMTNHFKEFCEFLLKYRTDIEETML